MQKVSETNVKFTFAYKINIYTFKIYDKRAETAFFPPFLHLILQKIHAYIFLNYWEFPEGVVIVRRGGGDFSM